MEPTSKEALRAIQDVHLPDYRAVRNESFQHFFCPVLFVDEPATICMGHVTPETLGGTIKVAQRKDVDNFYGSRVEADFIALINSREMTIAELFQRNKLRIKTTDGEVLPHYFPKDEGSVPREHIVGDFELAKGVLKPIAIKGTTADFIANSKLVLVNEQDCLYAATATALKAAHLTLFKLFGYKYALARVGNCVGGLLGEFFLANRHLDKKDIAEPLKQHFDQCVKMMRPMYSRSGSVLTVQGTVSDRKCVHVIDLAKEKVISYGIIVRMKSDFLIVFLPGEDGDLDAYSDFLNNPPKFSWMGIGTFEQRGGDPSTRQWVEIAPES